MSEARRPVAIFANGHGDHLIALPALRALAAHFGGRLTLVCLAGARETFFADLPLRAVGRLPMRGGPDSTTFEVGPVADVARDCDLLLSLNPWHSASVDDLLARLAPARSVGFFPAFATALPLDAARHAMDLAFDLPRLLDPALALERFAGPPALPPDALAWARHLRRRLPSGRRLLAVHAETMPFKSWPAERFAAALDAFLARHPQFVAVVVGQRDRGLGAGRRVVPLLGLPLAHALAVVSAADLFLGVDSVMLHAADLASVPGVGLFGPTDPAEYGFRFGPHRHVRAGDRIEDVAVEPVVAALEALLPEVRRRGR